MVSLNEGFRRLLGRGEQLLQMATRWLAFEAFSFLASSAACSLTQVSPSALAKWSSTETAKNLELVTWLLNSAKKLFDHFGRSSGLLFSLQAVVLFLHYEVGFYLFSYSC